MDYHDLARRSVPVLTPTYLYDFLTSEKKNSSIDNYLMHMLDDAKPHWEKRKREEEEGGAKTVGKRKAFGKLIGGLLRAAMCDYCFKRAEIVLRYRIDWFSPV